MFSFNEKAEVPMNNYFLDSRPFQEITPIACEHADTRTKAFRSVVNHTQKSNVWLHVFTTLLPVFDQNMCHFHVTIEQTAVIDY